MERCGICVSRQKGKVPISGRRSENMADMKIAENVEPLKKRDKLVKRNANGQFERGSKALAGAGRPPGSLNKTTVALKQAILDALEAAGGEEGSVGYLKRLAIENSSAFSGLLAKVLPSTIAASDSDGGAGVQFTFRRIIVYRCAPGNRYRHGLVGRSARPLIARSCCLSVRDSCRRCRSLPASTGLGHDHTGRQSAISNDGRVCRV